MNALKAKEFYRRDVQYIVRDGKALIINEVIFKCFFMFSRLCFLFILWLIMFFPSVFLIIMFSFSHLCIVHFHVLLVPFKSEIK